MKALLVLLSLAAVSNALIDDTGEDCIVLNPLGNTIVTAGEKMKIMWANSHATTFSSIYLVQSDGVQTPIVLATDVPTAPGQIIVDLPRTLVPSNAYYMTLGTAPNYCKSGNLRIVGAAAVIPNSKPPNGLENQISSGRFPKGINDAISLRAMHALPITALVMFLFTFIFMLS